MSDLGRTSRGATALSARSTGSGLVAYLKEHPCVDCGEIDKCDVRCANCHRRRTAADFGWWRHMAQLAAEDADDDLAS
jgi:hypothetical protein